MIITIDGPSASGKSSLASMIAKKLGLYHLNSGLLFRGMAYILITYFDYKEFLSIPQFVPDGAQPGRSGEVGRSCRSSSEERVETCERDLQNPDFHDINKILLNFHYIYKDGKAFVLYDNADITQFLKSPKVDQAASILSLNPFIREQLLQFQRTYALTHQIVVDGRDTGTIVFPHADLKIFLTADPKIRTERWHLANLQKGKKFTQEEALKEIEERDKRDAERKIAPLKPAYDAFVIDNSNMDLEQTFQKFMQIFNEISKKF